MEVINLEIIKHKINWDESEHVYNVSADSDGDEALLKCLLRFFAY
ncbi:hypothetical protein [Brevibacillus laterosporus]